MAKYKPRIDHSKKDYESESEDIAQDKKVVKKAFSMHDKQSHEGEKTDLSKLKRGGRAKKEVGTVRKYAAGGMPAAVAGNSALNAGIGGKYTSPPSVVGNSALNAGIGGKYTPPLPSRGGTPGGPIRMDGIKNAFGVSGSGANRLASLQKPDMRPTPAVLPPPKPYKKGGAVDDIDGKGGKSSGGKMGGLSKVPADKGPPHTSGVKKVAEKFNRGGKC